MNIGDIVSKDDHSWRVMCIHLGALGQESLIEVENVTHENGWTGQWEWHPRMFIPEILLRDCTVISTEPTDECA